MRTIVIALLAAAAQAVKEVSTADELYEAIADQKRHIALTADIDLPTKESVMINYEVTIDGGTCQGGCKITANGHSVFVVGGEDAHLDLAFVTLTVGGDDAEGCIRVNDGAELEVYFSNLIECENHLSEPPGGGGIFAADGSSSVFVGWSMFLDCSANEGGGMASMAEITTVFGSIFASNEAQRHGSALVASKLGGTVLISEVGFGDHVDEARSTIYITGAEALLFEKSEVSGNDNKGAGVVVLSKLKNALFKTSTFKKNKNRAIRMFQMFEGGIKFQECEFKKNKDKYVSDSSPGGAAIFAKESSMSVLILNDCSFEDNFSRYKNKMSQGGALWLGIDTKINGCSFVRNEADEGGAIYVAESIQGVVIKDTYFEENHATTAGGAIAVVATSSTATFPGQLKLKGLSAGGRGHPAGIVDAADGPKTGGSFLKMNGGDLAMSGCQLGDTGLGLRYTNAGLDLTDYSGLVVVCVVDNAKVVISDCGATLVHSMSAPEIDVPFKGYNDDGFFNIKCED